MSFLRLARVRLAAEAFSYLTLRGIAGEPLKVVLLADRVPARDATAAVALERVAYLVGTTLIVGIGSVAALVGLPLSHLWFRVFRAFAIAAGVRRGPDRAGDFRDAARISRPRSAASTQRSGRRSARDSWRASSPRSKRRCSSSFAAIRSACVVLLDRHGAFVRLHGGRSVGDPPRQRRRHHAERRAGRRDLLARRQLRVVLHSGQPGRARSLEPGRGCRRGRIGRRSARDGAAAPRPVLGRTRAGDLSAKRPASRMRRCPQSTERSSRAPRRERCSISLRMRREPSRNRTPRRPSACRAGDQVRGARRLHDDRGLHRRAAITATLCAAAQAGGAQSRVWSSAASREAGAEAVRTGETGSSPRSEPGTIVSPALLEFAAAIVPAPGEIRDVPAGPDWRAERSARG